MTTQHFMLIAADGSVGAVFRVREDTSGAHDEWYDPTGPGWTPEQWGYVARFLRGDPDGMPISSEEAETHIAFLEALSQPDTPRSSSAPPTRARRSTGRRSS